LKRRLTSILGVTENEDQRKAWLRLTLENLKPGLRILDAGAGELQNKPLCSHMIYVSQDICLYDGRGNQKGLQTGEWDTSKTDIVSDICDVPEPDHSFDVILCSEVLEHLPDAPKAIDEFSRLLKPGGTLIITAPFVSLVHFAPYHFATGFSRYWYEHHLTARNFIIEELQANGDWFTLLKQEILRLPAMTRRYGHRYWPLSYLVAMISLVYFYINRKQSASSELACFGWHCVARREQLK